MRGSPPALLLAALTLPAFAQTPAERLTLADCVRLALANPSAATAARRQSEIAALGVSRSRAAFRPQARVNGGFTYNSPLSSPLPGSPELPSYVALNGVHEYVTLLTADMELDTSGRLRAARTRALADQDAAAAGVQLSERDLKRSVAGAYYRALLARRLALVTRDALTEARAFEARTKLLFDRGEAARADVAKASAQAAFLEQAATAAELDVETTNHELAAFWTSDVAVALTLEDVLDDPLPPSLETPGAAPASTYLRRPEIEAFAAQQRGFLADAGAARAERRPQLNMAFQYGLDSVRADFSDHGYAAFFNVAIPILDWSKAKNAARQLELQAAQVEDNRRQAERAFSKEFEDARSRVRLLHAQVATTQAQVAASQEDLRLSRLRYDGGEGAALDVVTAQSQLAQARTNYYTTVARYYESLADLDVASGK